MARHPKWSRIVMSKDVAWHAEVSALIGNGRRMMRVIARHVVSKGGTFTTARIVRADDERKGR